jgi:putative membrane protein
VRRFGVTSVARGIAMLVIGIIYRVQFMLELRNERRQMKDDGHAGGLGK